MTSPATEREQKEILRKLRKQIIANPDTCFFKPILRTTLLPWQLEAIDAVLDVQRLRLGIPTVCNHKGLQRISIVSGHGTGKTQLLALVGHIWNFVNYGLAAVTAPKQDQVKTRFFYRYKRLLAESAPWYRQMIKANTMSAEINGDETWGIQGETASEPENLAGYHDLPQLFLVDEGSSKRLDPMYQTIEGALSTPGSVLVEISNPTRIVGEFANHHLRRGIRELYYRMHVSYKDAEKLISPEWVKVMRRKYGEDSPIFKVRVLGEFVEAGERQLVHLSWLNEARDLGESFTPDGSIPQMIVSVDVADGALDSSVVTVGQKYDSGLHLRKQRKYNFSPSISSIYTAKAAVQMMEEFGGTKEEALFVVDAIGVGAGTAGWLMDNGYRVIRSVGGEASDNNKRFRNRRVQNYISLRDEFRDGRVFVDPDFVNDEDEWDEFCYQLVSIQSVPGTDRVEDIETKEVYKAREGKSPDRADSTAQQFTTAVPVIARGNGNAELGIQSFGRLRTANADW